VRIIIIAIEPLNCSALVGAFACLKFGQSRIAPAMWCPPQVRQMTTNIILLDLFWQSMEGTLEYLASSYGGSWSV